MALRHHPQEAPELQPVIINYINDVLVASEREEQHDKDMMTILDFLAETGHKAQLYQK